MGLAGGGKRRPRSRAGRQSEDTSLGLALNHKGAGTWSRTVACTSVCASVGRTLAEAASSRGFAKLERGSNFQPRTWRVVRAGFRGATVRFMLRSRQAGPCGGSRSPQSSGLAVALGLRASKGGGWLQGRGQRRHRAGEAGGNWPVWQVLGVSE